MTLEDKSMKILFLLGFSLHNLEEGLWLPAWSKKARRFHREVAGNEFRFALILITSLGYVLTFLQLLLGKECPIVSYAYCGFIGMMAANAVFPHLLATVALKRYAPGTITGLFLNLPFGLAVLWKLFNDGLRIEYMLVAIALVGVIVLASLNLFFKIGRKLIGEYS
jgi:hypothetical protein